MTMTEQEHAVVIAGAGPAGKMLAAELTLAGVDVAVLEQRVAPELESVRAGGLHARTLEVLDQRGVADRFMAAGTPMQVTSFATLPLDISDFPTRFNHGLALWQNRIEELMGEWVAELGVAVHRGRAVTGFTQDAAGVSIALADGATWRAQYLVGCDGGRSVVRKAAGIAFEGWEPTVSSMVAEAHLAEEVETMFRRDAHGSQGIGKLEDGRYRMVISEPYAGQPADPSLEDLRAAMTATWGSDFGVHDPTWISRFTDLSLQAAPYRAGRVLLAGDAAHIHYPMGGQGLNLGVQDAVNLGWKLAQVAQGVSPDELLDTYHAERHPEGARVVHNTMAQVIFSGSTPRTDALRDILQDLLALDEPRKRIAGMMSALDVHYDFGEGHPLLGRRMPDLDLVTADGPVRVYTLLHAARPVLLNLGAP
ncbi:MAG: FAD-dependent monooxygenase, partial [Thermomicrobiales bacterium]